MGRKWRSEEFVGGSLGRGWTTKGVLSLPTSSVTGWNTSTNFTSDLAGDQSAPVTNFTDRWPRRWPKCIGDQTSLVISLLPLIPLITLSYIIVFLVGLAFLLLISSGSPRILLSRTSVFAISPHLSPSSPLTCGVSYGSVLDLMLFNLYATPLSSLISATTISHLLYFDDTQFFIYHSSKKLFASHLWTFSYFILEFV